VKNRRRVASLLTLDFHASAISEASTVTVPASALANDLAILLDYQNNSSVDPVDVVPAGWTSVGSLFRMTGGSFNRVGVRASRKILVAGDISASITGMNGILNEAKVLLVFRPTGGTITTVDASTVNGQATSADPASQSVVASGQPIPLIVIGGASSHGGSAAFSTASPAFDATVVTTGNGWLRGGYKIYNSAPADHTIDMNDLGNNGLISFYLSVS